MRKKFILLLLCFLMVYFNLFFTPKAQAIYPISASIANMIPESFTTFFTGSMNVKQWTDTIIKWANKILWIAAKTAALIGSQMAVAEILGGDKAPFVSDWNTYLYLSPQQRTMTYMNSLFNQSTRGRASTLNYEGIGQKNDQYLKKQFQDSISPKRMEVNLRNNCSDPDNIFAGNNFKCLNSFLLPQNNPYGITMIAQRVYQSEMDKEKTLADKKQVNGFVAKEKNGRIISPAALLQNEFLSLDKMGVDTISNAPEESWKDIAIGVAARIAGAGMQAAFGTKESQAAARQNNNNVGNTATNYFNSQINQGMNTAVGTINSGIKSGVDSGINAGVSAVKCSGGRKDTSECCVYNGGTWKNGKCV